MSLYEMTSQRRKDLEAVLRHFELDPLEGIWPLLNRSLIHRSYRTEAGLDEDNERLEFIGDSVIGLACTEHLLLSMPESNEGNLSKMRATLVSRQVLGKVARQMDLGGLLLLGAGEERSGGRQRLSILGSALEAVCGALYLRYPWDELRDPIAQRIIKPAMELTRKDQIVDHKSTLQEWAQREHQTVPDYVVTSEGGPDHYKTFNVEVRLGRQILGNGTGRRKKIAENEAARDALEKLGRKPQER